ncbi:hypothetical protein EHI_099320 [Entamoeba histolytica HM-1:IMSS]|uniref:Uncharacterized protein n=3 Tax=Entamoeba histolytica TaxID=5759 RepID=C4M6C0_ENTH1|nr:hypothetical protein EHI_099320 [Entamoeba histolytica HM-1:IMSS]EAL46369.2 hypothetical protein EHI_099320 [Entamoeba histolytica HM-1:IMSS]|eukprot:XP_651755.2 hypothetical protein EHI_099320 [Entamoeba histolytica HM-1:IMSS]
MKLFHNSPIIELNEITLQFIDLIPSFSSKRFILNGKIVQDNVPIQILQQTIEYSTTCYLPEISSMSSVTKVKGYLPKGMRLIDWMRREDKLNFLFVISYDDSDVILDGFEPNTIASEIVILLKGEKKHLTQYNNIPHLTICLNHFSEPYYSNEIVMKQENGLMRMVEPTDSISLRMFYDMYLFTYVVILKSTRNGKILHLETYNMVKKVINCNVPQQQLILPKDMDYFEGEYYPPECHLKELKVNFCDTNQSIEQSITSLTLNRFVDYYQFLPNYAPFNSSQLKTLQLINSELNHSLKYLSQLTQLVLIECNINVPINNFYPSSLKRLYCQREQLPHCLNVEEMIIINLNDSFNSSHWLQSSNIIFSVYLFTLLLLWLYFNTQRISIVFPLIIILQLTLIQSSWNNNPCRCLNLNQYHYLHQLSIWNIQDDIIQSNNIQLLAIFHSTKYINLKSIKSLKSVFLKQSPYVIPPPFCKSYILN